MSGSTLTGLIPLVIAYAISSSTLLVANKWALELFPKPNLLMLFQFLSSYGVVAVMAMFNLVETDRLELEKVKKFIPVVAIFYAVLWSNLKALDALSVDLVILFRSLTPFCIAIGDYWIFGRNMPSAQSWFSLLTMSLCTMFIFVREPHISLVGILWGLLYYIILSIDMVYLKKIIVDVKLTTFGRVVYTNLLAAGPAIVLSLVAGEFTDIISFSQTTTPVTWIAVGITCVLGFGMSYLSWALRAKVSALTFVVIGILCKIFSVIINAYWLSKHLTLQSMILVCFGILASTLYEQPDARKGQVDVNKADSKDDDRNHRVDMSTEEVTTPVSAKKKALMIFLIVSIFIVQFWENILSLFKA